MATPNYNQIPGEVSSIYFGSKDGAILAVMKRSLKHFKLYQVLFNILEHEMVSSIVPFRKVNSDLLYQVICALNKLSYEMEGVDVKTIKYDDLFNKERPDHVDNAENLLDVCMDLRIDVLYPIVGVEVDRLIRTFAVENADNESKIAETSCDEGKPTEVDTGAEADDEDEAEAEQEEQTAITHDTPYGLTCSIC